MSIYF
jgi:heme-degrading monooxygenase HmoA